MTQSITGSNTSMGIKVASTWGTAVQAVAGDRFAAEVTPNFDETILTPRGVGSGLVMAGDIIRGNFIPTFDLVGDFGFRNGWDRVLACFFGTSPAPTEVTVAQGDWRHVLTLNPVLNAKFLTLAYETTTSTVMEAPTAAVQSIGLSASTIPGLIEASASLLAGTINATGVSGLTTPVNTNASLQATTFTEGDPEYAAINQDDYEWEDDQSSVALSVADLYAFTTFDFTMSRPQEIRPEAKGSAGNSAPVSTARVEGQFSMTVKELVNHTRYQLWHAHTARKLLVSIEGSQIGTGSNKSLKIYIPRVKMASAPGYAPTDEGTNPLSLSWTLLGAASAPTGMTSRYPYLEIVNTLATTLLP